MKNAFELFVVKFYFFSFVIPHTKDIKIIICTNVRALNFVFFIVFY